MYLQVKVVPKSQVNQVVGWEGELLRVKVRGVPEDNEVNRNLLAFLADFFEIPKSSLTIASGHTSRLKRLFIEEESVERVKARMMRIIAIEE